MKSIVYILKIIVQWLLELLYFPFWWYSGGLIWLVSSLGHYLGDEFTALAIAIWLKNIFVPMYGQRSVAGFLISFFMRLVQVIFRSIYWLILVGLCMVIVVVWLGLPIAVLTGIYLQVVNYGK